jgi:hypothetical protein
MLGTAASPTSTADETDTSHRSIESPTSPQDIPAPPAGGPRPTVTLNPNHGYFGQRVLVSGQGVAPYPGVRLAWLTGDATLTAAIVNVGATQAYNTTLTVPADAAPGPAKICAAVTGSALAEFACVDFTIDTPPPGSVQGQLPLAANAAMRALDAQAFNAAFVLRNNSGAQIASTPIQQNGSFAIAQVPPGTYQGTVAGSLPALVGDATVNVGPGEMTVVQMPPGNVPLLGDPNAPKGRTCNASGGVTPTVTARVTTAPITGTYIGFSDSNPAVTVTFEALPQMVGDTTVVSMTFAIIKPDKSEVVVSIDADSSDGWRAAYNVSLLPPGESYLVIKPFPSSGAASGTRKRYR